MATIAEMIVKLLADTGSFDTSMAEASATVKASSDAMSASYKGAMQSFSAFDAIQKGSLGTSAEVAAAQDAINTAQATGAFTAEELAAKQALVDAAMLKVGKETEVASAALGGFTRNSRTMYSMSALLTDAMTGQFSRSRREIAALGNETGLMAKAFRFALSPAGLLAGGIGVLAVATVRAEEDLNDFDESVQRTNGYMGISAGELQAAAQKIESLGVSYSTAKDAVLDLANSGRFTSKELAQAATAAAEFAQITGEKVNEVDKLMVEMATNPQKALDELVEKYHRVTPAQAEVIEGMIRSGDMAGATTALVQAMGTSVAESFDKQSRHAGMLDRMLHTLGRDFGEVWRGLGESLNVATGGGDAAEKLTLLQHRLADMRKGGETTGGYAVEYQALQKQAQELQSIIDKQHEATAAAKQTADAYAKAHPAQGTFAALQQKGFGGIDITGNLTKQLSDLEAAQKVSYADRENFESQYWGVVLHEAKIGTAAYVQAWEQVQSAQKRLDNEQLQSSNKTARTQEENARKAAEIAKEAAQGRARAEQQASQEIQQEIQKEAADRRASGVAEITGARQVGLARIAAARQQAQTEYDSGNISAAELLQIEQKLAQEKLAIELRYYQQKMALDQGDVAAQKADAAAITAAKLKADQTMSANTDRFIRDEDRKWKQYGQRVAGAFQNATNSMLFQGQTLRQGLASVAESIFETFMESVVNKPLQAFIAGEGEKLAAAIGFGSQKTAQEETQRAINAAADIADKSASAVRAAGLAGAQGVASFAGAPWPIDMGAPAFGAAMFAEAGAFASIASAARGWERVPADGMQTILHEDEMVLPKHVADPIRNMARGGGRSGGGNTYHIHALDSRSFLSALKRNPHAMQMALAHATRNGW